MENVHAIDNRLTAVETRLDSLATKTDLAHLETRIAQVETRLTRWMIAMLIGSTVAASSIAVLIQTLIG